MRFPLFLEKHTIEDEHTNRLYKPSHFLIVVFGSVTTQGPYSRISVKTEIQFVEAITWSKPSRNTPSMKPPKYWVSLLGVGAFCGVPFGLAVGGFVAQQRGLISALTYGVISGLFTGLVSIPITEFGFWLVSGFSIVGLNKYKLRIPNQGVRRSALNGLLAALGGGALSGVFFGLFWGLLALFQGLGSGLDVGEAVSAGLFTWLTIGLFMTFFAGIAPGLRNGGLAYIQHVILRLLLWISRCTPLPWHYVTFLDAAANRHLLRKVGGGYLFRHRLLQDYFASLAISKLGQTCTSFEVKRRKSASIIGIDHASPGETAPHLVYLN